MLDGLGLKEKMKKKKEKHLKPFWRQSNITKTKMKLKNKKNTWNMNKIIRSIDGDQYSAVSADKRFEYMQKTTNCFPYSFRCVWRT